MGVVGLIFGSFGTVVAHRVPRGESIVTGRSRCPSCGHTIGAVENIPVFSYLLQRGRCRHCGAPISVRYPLLELASGLLFATAAWKFGASLETVLYAAFFWVLIVLTAVDLEHKLLPNKIVFPSLIVSGVGLTVAAVLRDAPGRLEGAALGALIFGGFLFVVAFIYPAGMGGGDVKLGFVLGMFLGYLGGWGLVLTGMFLAFLLGGVGGIVVMLALGGSRKTQVPFGPFLALGTVLGIVVGQRLLDAYLGGF